MSESQGTQGAAISFKTRAGVFALAFTRPQNKMGRFHRDHITLYATSLNGGAILPLTCLNHKGGGVVDGIPFGGYACLAYAKNANGEQLLALYEDELGISLKDVSYCLASINLALKDESTKGVAGINFSDDKLIASYELKGDRLCPSPNYQDFILWQNPKASTSEPELVEIINSTDVFRADAATRMSSVAALGLDLRDEPYRLNTNWSISFECVIYQHAPEEWQWLFQWGEKPQDMLANTNWAAHGGIGFKKPVNGENATLNPVNDRKKNTQASTTWAIGTRANVCVVVTYGAGAKYQTYIDGVLVNELPCPDTQRTALSVKYMIFGNDLVLSKRSKVAVGNIRLYAKALSAEEVMQNAKAFKARAKLRELLRG